MEKNGSSSIGTMVFTRYNTAISVKYIETKSYILHGKLRMEELFLKTERGNLPIDYKAAIKYNLKRGEKSPFSSYLIADKSGSTQIAAKPQSQNFEFDENPQILTTSEVIDFMQGSDSGDA